MRFHSTTAGAVSIAQSPICLLVERFQQVDRHRKDDGGVFLGRDLVERLKIAQLKCRRRFVDDVSGFLESARRLVLTLRSNHLHNSHTMHSCTPGRCRHGILLNWQFRVFTD